MGHQYNDFKYRTNAVNDYTNIWSMTFAHPTHFIDPRKYYIHIKPGKSSCTTQITLITTGAMSHTLLTPIQSWANDLPCQST